LVLVVIEKKGRASIKAVTYGFPLSTLLYIIIESWILTGTSHGCPEKATFPLSFLAGFSEITDLWPIEYEQK
jgi:hypothetical protein